MCSACTDEYEANNGGVKECCEGVPFTVRAIVADFEELSNAGKSSTRTSVRDEHFKMEFVDGDSIGVFAIKDGAIMDNIDSSKWLNDFLPIQDWLIKCLLKRKSLRPALILFIVSMR